MHLVKIEGQTHSAPKGQPRGVGIITVNRHCFWGGGGLGPIHHHPKNQQPSGLDVRLPHQRGGGGAHHCHCRHQHWGGPVFGRGPFAQKRVLAGVACTGLVYYMRVTCPVPVLLLCPYHLEDVVARVYPALSSRQHQL